MKKNEILALINSQKLIDREYRAIPFRERRYSCDFILSRMRKGDLVPDIPEIREELNILRDEMIRATKQAEEARKLVDSIKCTHDVRLTQYGLGDFHKCVFCGKTIYGEGWGNWDLSRYRNAHCVNLVDINQSEADISGGYSQDKVLRMIKDIIKDKNDEDEIDLVGEFSKLNLKYCEINNNKVYQEAFIMIIGGTNDYKFSDDVFVTRRKLDISKAFLYYYLNGILDRKILIIDNPDTIKQVKESRDLKAESYTTIKELQDILNRYKQDFKLIIDISELYNYGIKNNQVFAEEVDLKLNEIYPNAQVIRIKNLDQLNSETLNQYFNKNLAENLYGYNNKKYYNSSEGTLNEFSVEQVFARTRKYIKD